MNEFNYFVSGNYNDLIRNGNDFLKSAWRCAGTDGMGEVKIISDNKLVTLPGPTVVNAAFAIEMYLKSLILFYGMNYIKEHSFLTLFQQLPQSTQAIINDFCSGKKKDKPTFEAFAEKHSQDFVDIRYYVTKQGWQGMNPMVLLMYAFNLSQVTKLIVKKQINNN